MRFFRPWLIFRWLYSDALFRIKTNEQVLCLTFDDGPDPDSTPGLLDVLDRHSVKAMFFCSGKAAERYPALICLIKDRGHLVGNHGYSHLKGWKTGTKKYLEDIKYASQFTSDNLFRPPYGSLAPKQYLMLRRSFRIIFWDIMPYDFDMNLNQLKAFEILKRKLRPGSLIVLHDTPGSSLEITSRFLKHAASIGYRCVLP